MQKRKTVPETAESLGAEQFLSRDDLAKRWGVTERTVRNWINGSQLQAFRKGRKLIRYRLCDIEAFEASAVYRRK